jgi:hypothetical protein
MQDVAPTASAAEVRAVVEKLKPILTEGHRAGTDQSANDLNQPTSYRLMGYR